MEIKVKHLSPLPCCEASLQINSVEDTRAVIMTKINPESLELNAFAEN